MNAVDRLRHEERSQRLTGAIALLVLLAVTAAIFLKDNPFAGGYELRAVFRTASGLAKGDEVRIVGQRVGEVTAIGDGPGSSALVTMSLEEEAAPVSSEARLTIEPRLLLEGAFYVRLAPGPPGGPTLSSGGTLPVSRTAGPVRIADVLSLFEQPTRQSLHNAIAGVGRGLGGPRGASGADGLRRAWREFDAGLPSLALTARALRGTRPGDLGQMLRSTGDMAGQLVNHPAALSNLITNINRVTAVVATRDRELAATLRGLSGTLRVAPPTLDALDVALPRLERFGRSLRPVLARAPRALQLGHPTLRQAALLLRRPELAGLLRELRPATRDLPGLQRRLVRLSPFVGDAGACLDRRVGPALKLTVPDGAHTTGDPAYLDLVHAFTAAIGAVPTFDGNGVNVRLGVTEGANALNHLWPEFGDFVGGGPEVDGVRPTWLGFGVEPPYRPDARCTEQALPDLSQRAGGEPTWLQPTSDRGRR